jgi:hypothetical protein
MASTCIPARQLFPLYIGISKIEHGRHPNGVKTLIHFSDSQLYLTTDAPQLKRVC